MVITEFEASGGPVALFAIREVNAHVSYFQQAAIKNKSVQFVSQWRVVRISEVKDTSLVSLDKSQRETLASF